MTIGRPRAGRNGAGDRKRELYTVYTFTRFVPACLLNVTINKIRVTRVTYDNTLYRHVRVPSTVKRNTRIFILYIYIIVNVIIIACIYINKYIYTHVYTRCTILQNNILLLYICVLRRYIKLFSHERNRIVEKK